jgi:spore germination protein GerM
MKLHRPSPIARDLFVSASLLFACALVATGWLGLLLTTAPTPSKSSLSPAPPASIAPTERVILLKPEPETMASAQAGGVQPQTVDPHLRQTAQVYWLHSEGTQFALMPHTIADQPQATPTQKLHRGLIYLLNQPPSPGESTTIPTGTRLLNLTIQSDGIHLNLSHEFAEGGGSSSLIHRVAQVLYTATSLDPEAPVYLSVEGQLLDEQHPLGGEGLVLSAPMTRKQFAQAFSF